VEEKAQWPFLIEVPLRVKTYDIDFAGIVSNIVYIRWLENLRLEMLSRYFPLEDQLDRGFAPVLAKTSIEYKRPLNIRSTISGRMWMSGLDSRRWYLKAEIVTQGKVAALAEQVGLFVRQEDGRPIEMPAEIAEMYDSFTTHRADI